MLESSGAAGYDRNIMSKYSTDGTKYHPLFEHLLYSGQGQLTMTFAEIEAAMEAKLPPSAYAREEWWSNSLRGHSQARAWMRAGYETSRIDLKGKTVTFTLQGWPEGYVKSRFFDRASPPASVGLSEAAQTFAGKNDTGEQRQDHPLFGIWKGKVKLIPGYDYTKPAFDPDDEYGT
jgi:hypothetical protein